MAKFTVTLERAEFYSRRVLVEAETPKKAGTAAIQLVGDDFGDDWEYTAADVKVFEVQLATKEEAGE